MSGADTLVVGLGSIGTRHARLLRSLGRSVATVSRRGGADATDLGQALSGHAVDYVVIANETSAHAGTLAGLAAAGYRGRVLVEKPLFDDPAPPPANAFDGIFVGYHLRFHPALRRMNDLVAAKAALAATAYVGQYLPDWRPGRDYRTTASATVAAGGGVLRDLSHELDYLLWLFGPWRRVAAITVKSKSLAIETEDIASILMECERCPAVAVHLNYHHRPVARSLVVETAGHSFVADLVGASIAVDGQVQHIDAPRDEPYLEMHRAVLSAQPGPCSAEEGLAVVELIAAIEQASAERRWVTR